MPENTYQKLKDFIQKHPQLAGNGGMFGGYNEDHSNLKLFANYVNRREIQNGGNVPLTINSADFINYLRTAGTDESTIESVDKKLMYLKQQGEIKDQPPINSTLRNFALIISELGLTKLNSNLITPTYNGAIENTFAVKVPGTVSTAPAVKDVENIFGTPAGQTAPAVVPEVASPKISSEAFAGDLSGEISLSQSAAELTATEPTAVLNATELVATQNLTVAQEVPENINQDIDQNINQKEAEPAISPVVPEENIAAPEPALGADQIITQPETEIKEHETALSSPASEIPTFSIRSEEREPSVIQRMPNGSRQRIPASRARRQRLIEAPQVSAPKAVAGDNSNKQQKQQQQEQQAQDQDYQQQQQAANFAAIQQAAAPPSTPKKSKKFKKLAGSLVGGGTFSSLIFSGGSGKAAAAGLSFVTTAFDIIFK